MRIITEFEIFICTWKHEGRDFHVSILQVLSLPPGTYNLTVTIRGEIFLRKIVIIKV